MTPDQRALWEKIDQLTQQMIDTAVPNELLADLSSDQDTASQPWKKIATLESERKQLLETFFEQPVTAEDAEQVQQNVEKLLAADQQIQVIAQALQKDIAKGFSQIGQNQRAVNAYQSISDNHKR